MGQLFHISLLHCYRRVKAIFLGHQGTCKNAYILAHRGSSGIIRDQVKSRKEKVTDVVRDFGLSGVNLGHRGTKNVNVAIF